MTVKLGMMADLQAEAGFNLDAEIEYQLIRRYIADGYVWTHVLNNQVADYGVGDGDGYSHLSPNFIQWVVCCVLTQCMLTTSSVEYHTCASSHELATMRCA